MHGAPAIAGEKCAVHRPKPNGAGSAEQKTSSAVKCATRSANVVEREPARLVVHHHLRQPGGARRRVEVPELVGASIGCSSPPRADVGALAEQRARAAAFDEMRDLPFAGTRPDADPDEARLLAREHRRVHARSVRRSAARRGRPVRTRASVAGHLRWSARRTRAQVIVSPDPASTNASAVGS